MQAPVKDLINRSLSSTNAHGLARLVNERKLYVRILWLLAWLVCCALFLRQFIGFIGKLQSNDVATNYQADATEFEFPDLYFCFDSPLSGSRYLALNNKTVELINATVQNATARIDDFCKQLTQAECYQLYDNELPVMKTNSLPYAFLVDTLGHVARQSVLNASIVRSTSLLHRYQPLPITEFYHPSNLRCFGLAPNSTERGRLQLSSASTSLYFQLMMDAADSRMGTAALPTIDTPGGKVTAPYWALDKDTLYWLDRWSVVRLYITRPGHFPGDSETTVTLEAGRSYNIQLTMSEQVRKEDPTRCIDGEPADIQLVNPYDNSAYTFAYDYRFCYNSAVQAQFQRAFNATCGFLPQAWPPATDRQLYNFSSAWGRTLQDVRSLLNTGTDIFDPDEPRRLCERARRCTQRYYSATVNSVNWPTRDSLASFLRYLDFPEDAETQAAPGLAYLKRLVQSSEPNASNLAEEFVRANFLQLQVSVGSATADRTTYVRAYSLESFVADVGGILGIYLGMSVLTACELAQFFHDLVVLVWTFRSGRDKRARVVNNDGQEERGKSEGGHVNTLTAELQL